MLIGQLNFYEPITKKRNIYVENNLEATEKPRSDSFVAWGVGNVIYSVRTGFWWQP
jgi:hypothetical protein